MNQVFEHYAENAFDKKTQQNSIQWKREWYDYNFKKFFPENKEAYLLDIGPGLGELLITEKEWGYSNGMAIDISPSIVQYCTERGLKCVQVEDSSAWLNKELGKYDLITAFDVLEHIPIDQAPVFLHACKNALKDTGRLIIQVPNIQSPESFLHRYNDLTHVFGYSQHTLEQLISLVGFDTASFFPFEEYPGDSDERKMLRRLRSIYWHCAKANRDLSHNLNPEILTPEIFVVLCKSHCELPDHEIEGEFENHYITAADVKTYLDRAGVQSELYELLLQNKKEIEKLSFSIQSELCEELLRDSKEIDKLSSCIEELRKRNIWLEEQIHKEREQRAQLEKEIQTLSKMLFDALDEQNDRLVVFVDKQIARLDQHNASIRSRLDGLEAFQKKILSPIKSFLKKK